MITMDDICREASQAMTEILREQGRRQIEAITPAGIRAILRSKAEKYERRAAAYRRLLEDQ